MFDIFLMNDLRKLMNDKSIVFLGDSNIRALYKDFLCLLRNSEFIPDRILRTKMENTVFGDKLVYHGEKTNARCYREEREASIGSTRVSFFFLTKVYDDYVKRVLKKITEKSIPDVIVVNSCLWDITRWGCDGVEQFKENLKSLMEKFKRLFPDCLIIWITTSPIAAELKGGFLVKELQFLKYSLRFHIVEANHYARKIVAEKGFDVLDTHYHMHMQIHRRSKDGIHWLPKAVRYITNLLLRHISLSWDVALPQRYECISMNENLLACGDAVNPVIVKLQEKENIPDTLQISPRKLIDSSECHKKTVKANKQQQTKEKISVPPHKVSRKENSVHNHMAKKEKAARKKRIRKWKKACSSSTVPEVQHHPEFNPNFQPYNATYHPYQTLDNQNFQPNIYNTFPSYNYVQSAGFVHHGETNFSDPSHFFQNFGVPYAFPPVDPGQSLQLNDNIPQNFYF